jgi:hypothetical protein
VPLLKGFLEQRLSLEIVLLMVTFGTINNFHKKYIYFDEALPPMLYKFVVVVHYGYLVLNMLGPAGSSPY